MEDQRDYAEEAANSRISLEETVELRGRRYLITDRDGNPVTAGSKITSFRGEAATFVSLERGPEYNGTSKVVVRWIGADNEQSSRLRYYHTVFDLIVTPVSAPLVSTDQDVPQYKVTGARQKHKSE
jgi:hypothetical protein